MADTAQGVARNGSSRLTRWIAVFGPGLVVMLADTDVGSLVTAGQSGGAVGLPPATSASAADADPLYHTRVDGAARHLHRTRPW